jgi:hypothetical protein
VHGDPHPDVPTVDPVHWRRRALITATWISVAVIPPCLALPDSWLRRHDLRRRVTKVLRLLEPILVEAAQPHLAADPTSAEAADLTARALKALEVAVTHTVGTGRLGKPRTTFQNSRITDGRGQTILVIDDDLEMDVIARHVAAAQRDRLGTRGTSLVLPRSVLAYLLRHFDPFWYAQLLERAELLEGPHPLNDIAPPGPEELAHSAMDRMANLSTFVRGHELFSEPLTATFVREQLDRMLIAASLLRTNGHSSPTSAQGEASEFAEYERALEEVERFLGVGEQRAARQAAFNALRSVLTNAPDLRATRSSGSDTARATAQ